MSDQSARALGRKIAFYRTQRGLSQRDFGAMIDRSETWVSQVERGVRRVDRMTVLRTVADVLGVAVSELAADTPIVAASHEPPQPAVALRMLLSTSLALSLAVQPPNSALDNAELRVRAEQVWQLTHDAAYGELIPLLTEVLPAAEAACRMHRGAERRTSYVLLAKIYHGCAAALAKLGEIETAWISAERAITAAERAGDKLLMGEGAFRLTLVFQAGRRHEQAELTARSAIAAIAPLVDEGKPPALSIAGALRLQLAIIGAKINDPDMAHAELAHARRLAEVLGDDRNDFETEFGPTNVQIQEVAVAVEFGDAGTALRLAEGINVERMSPERRARLLLDVARAHMQRRNVIGVMRALLEAERLTPEQVHKHRLVKGLIYDLARSGFKSDPSLRQLANRCGIRLR